MATIIGLPSKASRTYSAATKIGIVIQARMTSKRFPGKSLALLAGKPVIEHVVNRAKLIRGPIKIRAPIKVIVAVPDTPESEPLLETIARLGADNFCGPEDNVLERYMGAANCFKLDVIMRITGDCPLIDPKVCSEVLQLLLWRKLDYASNVHPERTFPKGLDCEVFTYDALEVAYVLNKQLMKEVEPHEVEKLAQLRYDQEHVTPFMQRNEDFTKALLKNKAGVSKLILENYCIDNPDDIRIVENVILKEQRKPKLLMIKASNGNAG